MTIRIILFLLMFTPILLTAQDSVYGVWKAIDDGDGEATSHIEVFEQDGKLHGKIVKLLQKAMISCVRIATVRKKISLY